MELQQLTPTQREDPLGAALAINTQSVSWQVSHANAGPVDRGEVSFAEAFPDVAGKGFLDCGTGDVISAPLGSVQIFQRLEAMPEGGTIVVETTQEGAMVKASVIDCGRGMPEDVQERIFEPFYTSKREGTGLGLAICYSLVNAHGGSIEVSSQEGQGSCFEVLLPAAEAAPITAQRATA